MCGEREGRRMRKKNRGREQKENVNVPDFPPALMDHPLFQLKILLEELDHKSL